jgi:beta-glucanase (GH16 family)
MQFTSPENNTLLDATNNSLDTHDELDFEFLGNVSGQPIVLQTNAYLNGKGGREVRHSLPFDPTADFHKYSLLWNQNLIMYALPLPEDFLMIVFLIVFLDTSFLQPSK